MRHTTRYDITYTTYSGYYRAYVEHRMTVDTARELTAAGIRRRVAQRSIPPAVPATFDDHTGEPTSWRELTRQERHLARPHVVRVERYALR